MYITKTNEFDNAGTLVVLTDPGAAGQDVEAIETFDFSEKYTSGGVAATFSMEQTLDSAVSINYVSIAGHNFGEDGGTVEVFVDSVSKGSYSFADGRNSVVTFIFTADVSATVIKFVYTKITASFQGTLAFLASGTAFEVPNEGENSGYRRPWLTRNLVQRVIDNDQGAPVAVVRQAKSRKLTLTLRNQLTTFVEDEWRDFVDFLYDVGAFFIIEDSTKENSSYLCFNGVAKEPTAHGATRALQNVSISFLAYTGLE